MGKDGFNNNNINNNLMISIIIIIIIYIYINIKNIHCFLMFTFIVNGYLLIYLIGMGIGYLIDV